MLGPSSLEGESETHLCFHSSFMNMRDFLQFYPHSIYNSQYVYTFIRQALTLLDILMIEAVLTFLLGLSTFRIM